MDIRRSVWGLALAFCFGVCVTGQAGADSGWVDHKDPSGFSVQVPQGWRVNADAASGRIQLQGSAGEQVVLWPVFMSGALNNPSAAMALQRLAPKLWPNTQWERPQTVGTAAVRTRGRSKDRLAVASFAWVTSPKGSAGTVYAASAPPASYRALEETFARVIQSFRVVGRPESARGNGPGPSPALSYVRWQDPREQSYSMEVPRQWQVSGGTFRFAPVDVRSAWTVVSPDGQIRITGGDAELPTFVLPNQTMAMGGFTEGRPYSPGYGVNMIVRRYVPGLAFAKEYVAQKVARGCSNLTLNEARERTDAVQALNALNAQYGLPTNMQAGDISFTCQKNGQTMTGYYFATTQLTQMYGSGIWNVAYLGGYMVAAGREAQAQAVFNHILNSIQVNPQWANMQQNVTANTSKIVSRTSQEVSKIISDSYWSRQRTMDEISRRRSNATLGVVDVQDPVSGREFKLESGSNYYWIDHRGAIVGTDIYNRPNIDFREMIRLP